MTVCHREFVNDRVPPKIKNDRVPQKTLNDPVPQRIQNDRVPQRIWNDHVPQRIWNDHVPQGICEWPWPTKNSKWPCATENLKWSCATGNLRWPRATGNLRWQLQLLRKTFTFWKRKTHFKKEPHFENESSFQNPFWKWKHVFGKVNFNQSFFLMQVSNNCSPWMEWALFQWSHGDRISTSIGNCLFSEVSFTAYHNFKSIFLLHFFICSWSR